MADVPDAVLVQNLFKDIFIRPGCFLQRKNYFVFNSYYLPAENMRFLSLVNHNQHVLKIYCSSLQLHSTVIQYSFKLLPSLDRYICTTTKKFNLWTLFENCGSEPHQLKLTNVALLVPNQTHSTQTVRCFLLTEKKLNGKNVPHNR